MQVRSRLLRSLTRASAALSGGLEKAKILLNAGAYVNAITYKQHTPYDFALMKGHLEVAQFLREKGGLTFDEMTLVAHQVKRHLENPYRRSQR